MATPSRTCTSSAQVSGQSCGHAPLTTVMPEFSLMPMGSRVTGLQNAIHEAFALRQLIQSHILVGSMRLRDVAGSADHRRNPHLLKKAGFGAIRHFTHG